MKKQIVEQKTFASIMRAHNVVLSVGLSEGFANISFDENEKMVVQFLNDEGYAGEEIEHPIQDIDQVSRFIADLKSLRLDEAKSQ
jgi:hypothetical protein